MKKKLFSAALSFAAVCQTILAGGLNTNTNQNASFLRLISQNAYLDVTSLYVNPAGTAFLAPGHHLSLSIQNANQSRTIDTTFPLFALNKNVPGATHNFEGKAYAPVIPSFQYSYNTNGKWSFNAQFALVGGGGKCEFDNGLGSFEALYAGQLYQLVPTMVNQTVRQQVGAVLPGMVQGQVASGLVAAGIPQPYADMLAATTETSFDVNSQLTGYGLNAYMKGKQYYFGLTVGATYKVLDNLAISAGVRGIYAMCNYNGFVQDVKADYAYNVDYKYNVPANATLGFPGTSGDGKLGDTGSQDLNSNELALNADQTGFGVAPIIGIDWKINDKWNIAAKYEFKTRLRLENKSEMNATAAEQAKTNPTLGQFADGTKIAGDIPSLTTIGVQYSPVKCLKILGGYNLYGDKSATQYGNKQDLIDSNTYEFSAGVEWDIFKYLTVSGGWQITQYGLSDAYMNDLSFTTSSNSFGVGFRYNATERFFVDFGYMYTKYDKREVKTPTAAGEKIDLYHRTNRVLGLSVTFKM